MTTEVSAGFASDTPTRRLNRQVQARRTVLADRYFNPFQSLDISVPAQFHDAFTQYCHRNKANMRIDQSPLPRMVDLWFLSVCVAARLNSKFADQSNCEMRKIIDGSIFSSDPWRIHTLMMIAICRSEDVRIVAKPRKMMAIANSLAIAGLPKVIEMLEDGDAEPIWNLSDAIDAILRNQGQGQSWV